MSRFWSLGRLAIRSIRAARARSLLVGTLLALMVAVGTSASIAFRGLDFDSPGGALAHRGEADVVLSLFPGPGLEDGIADDAYQNAQEVINDVLSPTDSMVVQRFQLQSLATPFGFDHDVAITDLDLSHPLAPGDYSTIDGRTVPEPGEVVLTIEAADDAGAKVGDEVTVAEQSLRVVGIVDRQLFHQAAFIVTTNDFDALRPIDAFRNDEVRMVLVPGTADDAQFMAGSFSTIFGRTSSSGVHVSGDVGADSDHRNSALVSTLVSAMIGIEVALVSAAALAVGVRRRTHQFGQLLTIGADHRHLRILVLTEAAILGLVATATGVAFGFFAAPWLLSALTDVPASIIAVGRNRFDWLGPAVLGFGAALAAAWWPARSVARLPVGAALAGRTVERALRRRTPVWGLAVLAAGTLGLTTGGILTRRLSGNEAVFALVLILVSVVAMMAGALGSVGMLLSLGARQAHRLPTRFRLVVRSSLRQRGRSWVTVAALVAVVGLPMVIATAFKADPAEDHSAAPNEFFVRADPSGLSELSELSERIDTSDTTTNLVGRPGNDIEPRLTLFKQQFEALVGEIVDLRAVAEVRGWDGVEARIILNGLDEGGSGEVGILTPGVLTALDLDLDPADLSAAGSAVVMGLKPADGVEIYQFVRGADAHDAAPPTSAPPSPGRTSPPTSAPPQQDGAEPIGEIDDPPPVLFPAISAGAGATGSNVPEIFVTPEAVALLDQPAEVLGTLYVADKAITDDQRQAITTAGNSLWVEIMGPPPWTRVPGLEFAPEDSDLSAIQLQLIVLAATLGVAVVIAAITAALSALELDPEIGSMIATGANPGLRRWMIGAQSAYHLLLAALIGVPLAVLVYWAAARGQHGGGPGWVVPWTTSAFMIFVLPVLVGSIVAGVFRSGRPVVTRRTT